MTGDRKPEKDRQDQETGSLRESHRMMRQGKMRVTDRKRRRETGESQKQFRDKEQERGQTG